MTLIHFNYTDSYNKPSRGSLAFTPHRRHAANETEILPKPITVPLLNGEVTVDLQPNPSTWVWIITEYFEQHSESIYTTIPDSDGVLEAVDLTRINPSTIPAPYNAVEPVWWAEMRQYKQTVTNTLLQSEEALTEAKTAIEVGSESVQRTQHNASLAKAYAEESREDSYASREYRDEAEQWRDEAQEQADRAASGPESAAQRAEDAAAQSESNEAATRGFRDEARDSASDARSSETSASGSASTATERASDARNEANRAESESNRAQGYADELMDGPRDYVEQAEAARDDARSYATNAQSHANTASTQSTMAQAAVADVENIRDETAGHRDDTRDYVDNIQDYLSHGPWNNLAVKTPYVNESSGQPLRWRKRADGDYHIIGTLAGGTREIGEEIADTPENMDIAQTTRFSAHTINGDVQIEISDTGIIVATADGPTNRIWIDHIIAGA